MVNSERVVLGLLRQPKLEQEENTSAEQAMRAAPTTFRPHVEIGALAHHMADHDLSVALITTSGGRLLGALGQDMALAATEGNGHEHHPEEDR